MHNLWPRLLGPSDPVHRPLVRAYAIAQPLKLILLSERITARTLPVQRAARAMTRSPERPATLARPAPMRLQPLPSAQAGKSTIAEQETGLFHQQ